jgi:hypothetical protein
MQKLGSGVKPALDLLFGHSCVLYPLNMISYVTAVTLFEIFCRLLHTENRQPGTSGIIGGVDTLPDLNG